MTIVNVIQLLEFAGDQVDSEDVKILLRKYWVDLKALESLMNEKKGA